MPLPSFLCIGAQKAGTSWLFENLQEHPGVWMPPFKEIHFFDHLFVPENRGWTLAHIRRGASQAIRWQLQARPQVDFSYIKYLCDAATTNVFSEAWYERLFDRPVATGKLCGDVTPEYSTIPMAGIQYVRRILGTVKIIYIIRDPLDRALSQLRMNIGRSGQQPSSDSEWISAADNPDIENRGDYSSYIPRWKSCFAAKDLLLLPYKRISDEPSTFLGEVEDFLGLSHYSGYTSLTKIVHESKKMSVPEFVVERLQSKLGPQVDFLKKEFGHDFV